MAHYPVKFDHPKERLHDTLWPKRYWPNMADKPYTNVPKCHSCVVQGLSSHYQMKVNLFPGPGSLELVAIHLLVRYPDWNQEIDAYLSWKTDIQIWLGHTRHYSSLDERCDHFVNWCFISYRTPTYLLTENELRILSKFNISVVLGRAANHLTTLAYHP